MTATTQQRAATTVHVCSCPACGTRAQLGNYGHPSARVQCPTCRKLSPRREWLTRLVGVWS